MLDKAPQSELRALFDALQLDVVFQPADSAVDVAGTLFDRGGNATDGASHVRAEDWLAPPASQNANLEPLVEAPAISLAARYAKVRREGYAK